MSTDEPAANTRRFRWLDRWLEPRWRALLTWVAIAAVIGLMLDIGNVIDAFPWLERFTDSLLFSDIGVRIYFAVVWRFGIDRFLHVPNTVLFLCWFQPVVLRLGFVRVLTWIGVSVILGTVVVWLGSARGYLMPSESGGLIAGQLLGIPGLVSAARRTRPWMSIVAGIAATLAALLLIHFDHTAFWYAFALPNLIYGAVMLYGTDPLPRPHAERPLGAD